MNLSDSNLNSIHIDSHPDFREGDRLYFLSRYSQAYEAYKILLEQISTRPDVNLSELPSLYHKLGLSSYKLGKFLDAHSFFEKSLDIAKSSGNDILQIAKILYANGEVYTREGNFLDAEKDIKTAFELIKNNFGEDHRELIACYNRFAYLDEQKENYEDELEWVNKALRIGSLLNDELDCELTISYYRCAIAYWYEGEKDKASESIAKCLSMRQKIYGEDHVEISLCYKILGDIEYYENKYLEAQEYYERGINTIIKFFGYNHLELDDFYCNMGRLCFSLGNYDKSLEYHQKTLEIEKTFFPEDHHYMAHTYGDFGNIYKMQGRFHEALDAYNKALAQFIRKFGENHWRTAAFLGDKADVYVRLGLYSQAIKLVKKKLAIEIKCYSSMDERLASTYNYLNVLYYRDNKYKKALQNSLTALNINSVQFQKNLSSISLNCNNMKWIFHKVGDIESQETMLKKSLVCKEKEIGRNNGRTRETAEYLEEVQREKHVKDRNNNVQF